MATPSAEPAHHPEECRDEQVEKDLVRSITGSHAGSVLSGVRNGECFQAHSEKRRLSYGSRPDEIYSALQEAE